MALDQLLQNEAQAEIDRVRGEAQAKARAIIEEAQGKASDMVESRQRALEREYQAGLTRARSSADLELNAARLSAGNDGISQVFGLVEQQLRDISKLPEYREILGRLLNEAREAVPNAEVLEVNPDDLEVARTLVSDLEVRGNPDVISGVRLVSSGGKSGLSNTLLGRLNTLRGQLTPQVRQMLTSD